MRRSRTKTEVADLIERFLDNRESYPQEWNDFVECSDPDPAIDAYRKKCYDLDPLVNTHEPADEDAVLELRHVIEELRGKQQLSF
jgi:hypothetical protein